MKIFLIVMAIIGTIWPWMYFAGFVGANGLDIPLFYQSMFVNDASGGAAADLHVSILVFWVWATLDGRSNQVPYWWLVYPAGLLVGLSLALPLYLYLRLSNAPART